ncbi:MULTISPECIES: type III secretion system stalk subunit SctO [unclassified Arthrobacter]|uniref:type III secretion system stalk subunit SctO n=1 Tax=unclassified Arthrobacter TaxID=235627 RepID=UPI001492353F|nr:MULTISPECIES: YscO family type III secretion system apparatus protein [unclassified Arthrobacter]MBE0009715.1 hypothetical protein [Arthrobacter sp. AET 35A]NOJ59940.1 YscO family type III secretion system apparatus protein [Arthrobacter sp. 260]NOJ63593.1 YscO family type III secretion system apparatus protein [Arthrobacter sp. 147(2020)]
MGKTTPSDSAPLAEAAAYLYGLPLEEFTAERNARAKDIADKEMASQVKKLPKPSLAGWLMNMLTLHRRPAVDEALALGVELRAAQENLDQARMKDLGQQRQRLLAGLGKDSLALAKELGHGVSASVAAEIEQTFRAAMTDPDAAAAVATGRLLRALTASGWDAVDLAGAVGGPFDRPTSGPASGSQKAGDDGDAEVEDARNDLEDAERTLADADDDAEDAGRRIAKLQDRRQDLSSEIEELQRRLTELRNDLRSLDGQIDDAERVQSGAVRAARDAQRAVDKAKRQLERLLG